ncbi:aspartate aminotransferase family protein [Thalassorhabdomicrobium marinisediminis]|uniref:Aspartate aminotransferase family protein n=1 Tax=Thalassorhabdomicrobium marinisediminis TaxID=2170577 RepID=A0A2T7FTN1_9RHOB|nr:aspartate aminotransferase family protein [Thalassorhabdomicrobium marinisediminis]PVA05502.1 aspartate aminotransferase family protein [Thalassorhabdomicrobium marinisediminis]
MSSVFHRASRANLPTAIRGDGCYIIDDTGKRYLDACGGAAVSCLGHSNEKVRAAMHAQLDQIAYAHTGFFTSEPTEALAALLVRHAPGAINHAYIVSSGSEAIEAAIKLARQYFLEKGEGQRHRIIARRQSYHGNTLGALAAGGNAWRRKQFDPLLIEASHIAPCYAYRGQEPGETAEAYGQRVADELQAEIDRLGAESVMAFIAEPVVGATLGAVPPVAGYFKRIREICDANGILLILDEVMCGMGRTGSLFACEQDGIAPDIVTIAKGLGAGYQPIGAMLCTSEIFDTIADGSGFFQHGHTYLGHPMATAAALAVVTQLTEGGLIPRVQQLGEALSARLETAFSDHAHVGDIRGRGLFRGLEIVADRDSKAPFNSARAINKKIKAAGMEAGLMCYPMGGTIDGQHGDHVLLAPPFIISEDQLDEVVEKLGRALDTALTQ